MKDPDQNINLMYEGSLRELIPIVLINTALSIITFGVYRFWAKTKIRRYFYSRASFLEQPLEYTGTGAELFIGFLIIICVLIPIGFCSYFLPVILLGYGITSGPAISQGLVGLIFFYLSHIAVYRAQRYRLSRTIWRGIRAELGGSSLTYANQAVVCTILTIISLGLSYPYMQVRLLRYRIENSVFGGVKFKFDAKVSTLMQAWVICLGVTTIFSLLLFITVQPYIAEGIASLSKNLPNLESLNFLSYLLIPFIFLFLLPFTMIWYKAVSIRHFCNSIYFGAISAQSSLSAWNIVQIYLPLFFSVLIGIIMIFGLSLLTYDVLVGQTVVIALFSIFYLFVPIIILHRYFDKIIGNLKLTGSLSPEELIQSKQITPTSGEGLADALDIGAF